MRAAVAAKARQLVLHAGLRFRPQHSRERRVRWQLLRQWQTVKRSRFDRHVTTGVGAAKPRSIQQGIEETQQRMLPPGLDGTGAAVGHHDDGRGRGTAISSRAVVSHEPRG